MADLESAMEDIEVKACELVSELRNSIQKMDNKHEELYTCVTAIRNNLVELTKDQQLLKQNFFEVGTFSSSSDHANGDNSLGLKLLLSNKLETLKKEGEEQNQKLLLCCHLCDLLSVVSEDWEQYAECSHFKYLLQLLKRKQGKTYAIKRILYVIKVAEKELLRNGKHKISEILEGSSERSILAFPNLSQEKKNAQTVLSGLEECKVEVDKIGLIVTSLKTIHLFIFEKTGEERIGDGAISNNSQRHN
ncbi:hypothetical protein PanWU01x14_287030 [Parasponia andersonii]|uniref:Uncharacterized protein n=1 Tax=Parasponia andersonii TaxID=3476 RepID=A0A2P5AYW7_PARAD|nr:hypothetical protein PanWU01x14_287030 [Parasponia andersonii]